MNKKLVISEDKKLNHVQERQLDIIRTINKISAHFKKKPTHKEYEKVINYPEHIILYCFEMLMNRNLQYPWIVFLRGCEYYFQHNTKTNPNYWPTADEVYKNFYDLVACKKTSN